MGTTSMSGEVGGGILAAKVGGTVIPIVIAFMAAFVGAGVGFTIIPLQPGNEIVDAARRFIGGIFCSFTLGLLWAVKMFDWFPEILATVWKLMPDQPPLVIYVVASIPFLALAAVPGFWIVAGITKAVVKNADSLAEKVVDRAVERVG